MVMSWIKKCRLNPPLEKTVDEHEDFTTIYYMVVYPFFISFQKRYDIPLRRIALHLTCDYTLKLEWYTKEEIGE